MRYAIIVLLLGAAAAGLLIPAVNRVREAANRSVCTANISYLSNSLHSYADANGHLPSATLPGAGIGEPPSKERRLGWTVALLPYMEESVLHSQFDLNAGSDTERNQRAAQRRLRLFVCPTSGLFREEGNSRIPALPLNHYIGVAGLGDDASILPITNRRAGVFSDEHTVAIKYTDISDGFANTLLLFESGHEPGNWALGGRATVRGIEVNAPLVAPGAQMGGFHSEAGQRMWSERAPIAFATTCAGNVRSITADITPIVLAALVTANGGDEVPVDW